MYTRNQHYCNYWHFRNAIFFFIKEEKAHVVMNINK
jgi:hypothetical protein